MNQVASAHGPGLLLGMLHMSHLAANTAAEDGLMLHAAAAAAGPSSQADMAAAACSTPDSPTDAPQPDFDAAQLQQSHPGFAGSATEDSLQQLKKECKPHKGTPKKHKAGQGRRQVLVCKVDDCGVHLGGAKAYYQRHKVCAVHLSAMCARVNGVDSRFCQQCGKFQPLEEFDADKRSCRARLKRHNNRRREQRHSKNYEFALELHCQAAAHLLDRCEDPTLDPFLFPGLDAPYGSYGSPRYPQQQYSMPGGYGPPDGALGLPYIGVGPHSSDQQQYMEQPGLSQQQQEPGLDMMDQWAAMDCTAAAGGPQHSTGNNMAVVAHSNGPYAAAGNSQHSSPALSSHAAAMAGAGPAAAAGAGGIPASLQRVSASRALEALWALHASSYSTESDWEDAESEEVCRSPTAWQQQQQRRMGQGTVGHGPGRALQGSRLRDSRHAGSSSGMGYPAGSMPAHARYDGSGGATGMHSMGHLGPDMMDGSAQHAGHMGPGFNGAHLNPGDAMQQYGQHGGDSGDMSGWDVALGAQLQAQQQGQMQQGGQPQLGPGHEVDACGAGAGVCASYDNSMGHMQQQQQVGGLMTPAQAVTGPLQHQGSVNTMQHSAPAGLCYQSRTSSPAVSTGGSLPGLANNGPGLSLLGPGGRKGAHVPLQGRPLHPQWSLPAQNGSAHEFPPNGSDGFMHGQQQQHCYLQDHQMHHNSDPGQGTLGLGADMAALSAPLQEAFGQRQGPGGGMELGPFQPHELHQVLQGLLAGTITAVPTVPAAQQANTHMTGSEALAATGAGAGAVSGVQHAYGMSSQAMTGPQFDGMQHCSPPAVQGQATVKVSPGTPQAQAAPSSQPGMNMNVMAMRHAMNMHGRTLSPQSSMTPAAAATAAAVTRSGAVPVSNLQHGQASAAGQHLLQGLNAGAVTGVVGRGSVSRSPGNSPGAVSSGVALGPGTYSINPVAARPADSAGGSSLLREELACVHLGSGHWQQQEVTEAADVHMADANGVQQQVAGQRGPCVKQSDSPTVASDAAVGAVTVPAAGTGVGDAGDPRTSAGEVDSGDSVAAVATFEAQLAACDGNRDDQEAVLKAWLDALLPDQQPGQQCAAQQQQQQQQQQQALQGAQHEQRGPADIDIADVDVSDLEAATAAALQLAAQQAVGDDAHGAGADLHPEEDFGDLLDLLLDA